MRMKMKRVFRRNQIIITTLAIMIAAAGYLNYAGKSDLPGADIARVRVELAHGAIARVEAVGRLFHLGHADVVRQIVVEVIADGLRLHVRVHVGVCDHRPCMNARVRPACADHVDRRAAHPREHGLELALNGLLARLTLPAEKTGAVVSNGEFIVPLIIVIVTFFLGLWVFYKQQDKFILNL